MGLLGFQLDAIYHTSIQLNAREYVYDGNIVAIRPGSSHLGQPMQRLHLGRTECKHFMLGFCWTRLTVADFCFQVPMDVIEEYLDSLREIYTVAVGSNTSEASLAKH